MPAGNMKFISHETMKLTDCVTIDNFDDYNISELQYAFWPWHAVLHRFEQPGLPDEKTKHETNKFGFYFRFQLYVSLIAY